MKKILMSLLTIAIVGALIGGGAIAYFTDTETASRNVFTAGTIDISIDPAGGQHVVTLEGALDLKPCETGYTSTFIHNDGTNPADIWKHIANVLNQENGTTDAEREYYRDKPESKDWKLSNWIHYDLLACRAEKFDTDDLNPVNGTVEAEVVKYSCCRWVADILSVNAPHGVYGTSLAISLDGVTPSFQVWYVEAGVNAPSPYTEAGWYYQPYPWASLAQPVSEVDWIQVNDRDPTDQHFEVSIDCAHLGGPGATYYWAMQLRTNLITWLGVYDWGSDVSGFLVNHVYKVEITEDEEFMLTGPHYSGGVECNYIYLGVLQPGESLFVKQSYHLDKTVENWGQSDRVLFDMEFVAQQVEGTPQPPPPGTELPGYGK